MIIEIIIKIKEERSLLLVINSVPFSSKIKLKLLKKSKKKHLVLKAHLPPLTDLGAKKNWRNMLCEFILLG